MTPRDSKDAHSANKHGGRQAIFFFVDDLRLDAIFEILETRFLRRLRFTPSINYDGRLMGS